MGKENQLVSLTITLRIFVHDFHQEIIRDQICVAELILNLNNARAQRDFK
jgi:hypothetical protein